MNLYIMSGLPASGKTTYTKQVPPEVLVIHRDEWRNMVREQMGSQDYYPHGSSAKEYTAWLDYLAAQLKANRGRDILIDQVTPSNASALKLLNGLVSKARLVFTSTLTVHFIVIHTPIAVCKERNALRTGFEHVPDEAIDGMARGFCISEKGLRLLFESKPVLRDLRFCVHHLNDLNNSPI